MRPDRPDTIYSQPMQSIPEFSFGESVATVFDDMISRSVPLYHDVQTATARLTGRLAQPNTVVYDLGCASGTTLVLLAQELQNEPIEIIGVDNSAPMLAHCRQKLAAAGFAERVRIVEADVCSFTPTGASVIVLNYTMQFLPPAARPELLSKLFNSLLPGGALLLSEKVTHRSETLNRVLYEMHHEFKKENGYSTLEIAQKRDAIENVLRPLSTEENVRLLNEAGFREVEIFAKWYNFASFIAFRG